MPKLNKEQAQATSEAESAFGPLEEGVYLGTLSEVTVGKGEKGPYWSWRFSDLINTETDEKAPGSVWVNTSLTAEAQWKLKEVFDAFEVVPDTDTDELLGQQVQLVVSQREIERGARMGQVGNQVDAVLPIGGAVEN
jgi:hypothetical protein